MSLATLPPMPLCLTEQEIIDLTHKVKWSAQVRALREMGIDHRRRPDGSIFVDRKYYEELFQGGNRNNVKLSKEKTQPDWAA